MCDVGISTLRLRLWLLGTSSSRVTSEEARGLAEREGCEYQETSAKEATNVDECFYQMARDVYRLVVTNELNLQEPTLDIGSDTEGGGATRRCC